MCELTPLGDSSSEGGRGLMLIYLMAMKSGIWTMTSTCPICNTNDWKQDKNCHFDFGTLFQYLRQKLTLESKSAILIIFSAKIEILLNIKQIVSRIVLGLKIHMNETLLLIFKQCTFLPPWDLWLSTHFFILAPASLGSHPYFVANEMSKEKLHLLV